jgi:diguanylate cyclase (GGDEF)-like protein
VERQQLVVTRLAGRFLGEEEAMNAAATMAQRKQFRRHIVRITQISGAARVWALNLVLAALAVTIFSGAVTQLQPASGVLPWYVLALGFYLAEVLVVHFQFRREVHTFSLSEIPFVLGLFFATPVDFVLANVLGAFGALVIHRRQSPVKLAFNVSQFALGAAAGVTVFHLLRGTSVGIGPSDWFAALVATGVMNIVGIVTIAIAIALSEGRLEMGKLTQVFKFGLTVGATNTVVVLAAITFLWRDPLALWVLGVPAVVLYLAYRAYMSEREKHESLEFLYEATTILQRTPQLDVALVELLRHTRRMFKAEIAELTLVASAESREALRTSLGPEGEPEVMETIDVSLLSELWTRLDSEPDGFVIARSASRPVTLHGRSGTELRDALVAPLRGDRGTLGMMVVANRLGDVSTFDEDDLRLLETLARHAGVALENGRLGQSLNQLNELKEQLRHQAYHDSLTGLGNRALFQERVTAALSKSPGPGGPVVLFVDLDDFKTVNDSLGHAAGDLLLVAVAERLRACLRPSDLPARLGGDEFGILLERGELNHAIVVGERVMASLRQPFMIEGNEVLVRASVGIAERTTETHTADELLRDADVAMYTAKAQGKGRVAIFEPQMHAAVVARHALSSSLQRALDSGEFVVLYQPIVQLDNGKIAGAEALVRWRQADGTLLTPGEFMSLAEETGLILQLGRWVLETACRQAAEWRELAPEKHFRLGVNLSARQVQQPGFIEEVEEILRQTGLEPGILVLEITETVMMRDTAATIAKLNALKELGVQLAIDDFGTGYSSLSYLSRFPVDVLKMAQPFVESANREDSAFAKAIVGLGHSLKLQVVAEGIERPDQLHLLRKLGCEMGQGFYFSEALSAEDMSRVLRMPERAAVPQRAPAVVPVQPRFRQQIRIHTPVARSA